MTPHPVPAGPLAGTCIVALFAALWVVAGTRSLGGRWWAALSLLAGLLSTGLAWREYGLLRAGTHASAYFDGAAYEAAVAFESIAIPLTAVFLKRGGKQAYLLPAIALIVGIHFFGLVRAFHSLACWGIGAAMCLLSIATVACLPAVGRRKTGGEFRWWDVVVGLGCALILWFSLVALIG